MELAAVKEPLALIVKLVVPEKASAVALVMACFTIIVTLLLVYNHNSSWMRYSKLRLKLLNQLDMHRQHKFALKLNSDSIQKGKKLKTGSKNFSFYKYYNDSI
jgi:hypothetical protein